jgi:hypothetical protein
MSTLITVRMLRVPGLICPEPQPRCCGATLRLCKHAGHNPRLAPNAPFIGLWQVPRDVVSPGAPQAAGPHFPDASMHVQHCASWMVNLLPYTDCLVSTCDPPPDT